MIARGELKAGIELLQSSLPRLHADRYELYASAFVAELSQGLAALGRLPEALKVLRETIARVEPEGAAFDMPELLRLRASSRRARRPQGCGSKLCSICRAGRTARGAILEATNGDVACPGSTSAGPLRTRWPVWLKPMPGSPKALRLPICGPHGSCWMSCLRDSDDSGEAKAGEIDRNHQGIEHRYQIVVTQVNPPPGRKFDAVDAY